MSHFYTPWKRQKTKGFLKFSGGIDIWHWKNGLTTKSFGLNLIYVKMGFDLRINATADVRQFSGCSVNEKEQCVRLSSLENTNLQVVLYVFFWDMLFPHFYIPSFFVLYEFATNHMVLATLITWYCYIMVKCWSFFALFRCKYKVTKNENKKRKQKLKMALEKLKVRKLLYFVIELKYIMLSVPQR